MHTISLIILAISGGGVVIGDIIAQNFIKLDIVVSRKSGTPFNPEFAIGAVMPEDSYFLMILNEVADTINIPQDILILKLVNKQKK
jgi:predicted phosphoribosyltransferase